MPATNTNTPMRFLRSSDFGNRSKFERMLLQLERFLLVWLCREIITTIHWKS